MAQQLTLRLPSDAARETATTCVARPPRLTALAREEVMAARKSIKASAPPGRAPAVTLDDIEAARRTMTNAIVATDCDCSRTLSEILGCKVWLKFENQQFTASFKERGAVNRLSALSEAERTRGVIAMS